MASGNFLPTASGTYAENWTNGAGSVPSNINSNDGDTSYRSIGGGLGGRDTFVVEDLPGNASSVNSVIGRARLKRLAAGSGNWRNITYQPGGGQVESGNFSTNASYTLHSYTFPTDGAGAGWTVAKFNSSEFGYNRNSAGAAGGRATETYVTVDYEVVSPGGLIVFYSFLLPLVGGMLTLASFGDLLHAGGRQYAPGQTHTFRPDEVRSAYEEYQANRNPVHFDLRR